MCWVIQTCRVVTKQNDARASQHHPDATALSRNGFKAARFSLIRVRLLRSHALRDEIRIFDVGQKCRRHELNYVGSGANAGMICSPQRLEASTRSNWNTE
jgi:hypothetical protein